MPDIKTRESVKDIKVIDKSAVVRDSLRKAVIQSRQTASPLPKEGQGASSDYYAEEKVENAADEITHDIGHATSNGASYAFERGKELAKKRREGSRSLHNGDIRQNSTNYDTPSEPEERSIKTREHYRDIKVQERGDRAPEGKKASPKVKKARITEVRTANPVKTVEVSSEATTEAAVKAAAAKQRTAAALKKAAETSQKAAKTAAQAASKAVRACIEATKNLVAIIAAGGWIAMLAVVVICLVGLIAGSSFGIFFSSEYTGTGVTMRQAVQEINAEYQLKLDQIKASVDYDELEMSGSRAVWPEVLSVYAVRTTTSDNPQEVATMTPEKKDILSEIFWEMNSIDYRTETKTENVIHESDDGHGNILEEVVEETRKWLYITVQHKTATEMAAEYGFNRSQNVQLSELLDCERSMWSAVLYGIYSDNEQIVAVAISQLGNSGDTYWSWYGFSNRVEWCACFVSWCANECGYIENGICPKYSWCDSGILWFKEHGQWLDGSAEPAPGMIVFFDWDMPGSPQDGVSDHTGIVEYVENGCVHTVEGNSGDRCNRAVYAIGNYQIMGYGWLAM